MAKGQQLLCLITGNITADSSKGIARRFALLNAIVRSGKCAYEVFGEMLEKAVISCVIVSNFGGVLCSVSLSDLVHKHHNKAGFSISVFWSLIVMLIIQKVRTTIGSFYNCSIVIGISTMLSVTMVIDYLGKLSIRIFASNFVPCRWSHFIHIVGRIVESFKTSGMQCTTRFNWSYVYQLCNALLGNFGC